MSIGSEMARLLQRKPWLKGDKFNTKLYCWYMTQFVLDHVDSIDGEWVYDTRDATWCGSLHVGYAAWYLGSPIRVLKFMKLGGELHSELVQPMAYPHAS